MTIPQIIRALRPKKKISIPQLYVHIKRAGIKPVGEVRQIPQQYPEDTPHRLLIRFGLVKVTVAPASVPPASKRLIKRIASKHGYTPLTKSR